jgi:allantoate deiminase
MAIAEAKVRARATIARCRKLATFSEEPGRITRTFLSAPMRDCHQEIAAWLKPLGAETRIDAAGNFRAFYAAKGPDAPRLLIGSHLDTVPDAGCFDGVLGVVLGVALIEALEGERLPFGIEVVGFSEEEGVRFGTPFIGSRALVGRLDERMLRRADERGVSVRAAIKDFGLNPSEIPDARLQSGVLGYLEFHIEQGPVLEKLGLPLSAVEAVAGQSRLQLTFVGRAGHAGATPMHSRRDAVAAAAEWITAVEREARRTRGLLATVGVVDPKPGATNVIAGEARVTLDLRHRSDVVRARATDRLVRLAENIALRRGLSVRRRGTLSQQSVAMDPFLVGQVEQAICQAGCKPHRMVSGAGHDAMILAERVPAAMIFLRTPDGVSHNPKETVRVSDVEKAIEAGMHLLRALTASPEPQKTRVRRA